MKKMQINIIAKALIAKGLLLGCMTANAWTVSEWVVDMPGSEASGASRSERTLSPVFKKTAGNTVQNTVTKTDPLEKTELLEKTGSVEKTESLEPAGKTAKTHSQSKASGTFEKTTSSITGEEQALNDYRRALQHLDQGESLQAEKLLRNSISQFPDYHEARAELGTLYLKRNQLEEAERVLEEGLRLDEIHPDFLRLMAMVHDRKSEPEAALALLVKVKDSRKDKSYVAFLGHIYQETGQYALARQQYYRLLQEEPKNPLWLLGVSLALDGEGQRASALEGYQRLVSEGNIDPAVLKYVQDRIDILH